MLLRNFAKSAVLVHVVLLGIFTKMGSSISCFICDSSLTPGCTNLKGIKPETCTLAKMNRLNSSWLAELNRIHFLQTEVDVPMRCQKVVGRKEDGPEVVARHCQVDTKDTNPCTITEDKALEKKINITSCSVCDTDNCNSSPPSKSLISILGAALIALFLKVLI